MTAVLSTGSSPASSPQPLSSPPSNPHHPALPPLITSPGVRRSNLQRPLSHASKNRLSQYSNASGPSKSRPPSHIFPQFHSSLSYSLVRDFAYPALHPLHFGPPPEPSQPPSGSSTPASEFHRRLSDPPMSWESKGGFGFGGGDSFPKGEQLTPTNFGDGPPWSEDEDIQSPIVVSSRHKKHRSTSGPLGGAPGRGRSRNSRDEGARSTSLLNPENYEQERSYYAGRNGDGSQKYYVHQGGEANGPGGEFVPYPADQARHPEMAPYNTAAQRDSHFAGTLLPSKSYQEPETRGYQSDSDVSSADSSPGMANVAGSRYSRDYQFTIASPDEEMHGKAVALFDFQRENENELPLVEGQVIWVSYRHGQGWLVAEDPKTHESGLVPEEYVRLLRDIQGGLHSLTGQADSMLSPAVSTQDSGTPTQAEHAQQFNNGAVAINGNNGYQQPIVSTFSTSSKDLNPYPQHLLGAQAGMAPPQVVHYHGQRGGSQANTPTLANPVEGTLGGTRESEDVKGSVEGQDGTARSTVVAHGKVELSASPEEDESDESDED